MFAMPAGWESVAPTVAKREPTRERLFISGGISGVPNYKEHFRRAQEQLYKLGYDTVNPADIVGRDGWKWFDWMKASIELLLTCDGVALLPGYQYSKGANIEYALAESLGMPVRMVSEWCFELDR